MVCRKAELYDVAVIRGIAEEVWPVAYKHIISEDQMKYMLQWMYSDESLQQQMTQEGCVFFLLQEDERCTGFAGVSMVDAHTAKLHKLYVLSTGQGKGRGSTLLREAIGWSRSQGATSLELQVNKHNKAKDFYARHGFSIAEEKVFDIGQGYIMDDYIMVSAL
jgi:GNAT superfamily N-acetyltransferase